MLIINAPCQTWCITNVDSMQRIECKLQQSTSLLFLVYQLMSHETILLITICFFGWFLNLYINPLEAFCKVHRQRLKISRKIVLQIRILWIEHKLDFMVSYKRWSSDLSWLNRISCTHVFYLYAILYMLYIL